MKSCPVCHLLNGDADTKCGNCGAPLCSHGSDEGEGIHWDYLRRFVIAGLGLLDTGLLLMALLWGNFTWMMLPFLLIQAAGIAKLFFPDAMYKLDYWLLTNKSERDGPGDFYYYKSRFRGFVLLGSGIVILIVLTFNKL